MSPDYDRAAAKAAETLIKYNVTMTPVSPLPILEQLGNVLVISFSAISDASDISHRDLVINHFGMNQDAITSYSAENGRPSYVVAYNSLLPFSAVQHALAREMAHVILGHKNSTPETAAEASCFVYHLLCPRPLLHMIQATGIRITSDLLTNLTGTCGHDLTAMRRIPATVVPSGLNAFIRNNFKPFFTNFFEYYKTIRMKDGSAVADLGTFMDGYEE